MTRWHWSIVTLLAVAVIWASPITTEGACNEGQTAPCTRNGCQGFRECVGGRMLGCELTGQCVILTPVDTIIVNQVVPAQEVGILFDGVRGGTFNDRGAVVTPSGTTARLTVPNNSGPAFGKSAVAFARSRQPRLVPAPWTPASDTVAAYLANNIRFNVTFWILAGDFATQETRAASAVAAVNNAYTVEKAGIRIAWATVMDATADPDAAALLNGGTQQQFQNDIGFVAGEVNVYVIERVNNALIMGLNFDGTPVIVVGRDTLTFPQVLEHEIGHAFVLWHVGAPDYNFENVMWPVISAHFLTEGQTFRMHFHPSSQVNVFGLRPGLQTFVCAEAMTNECPANSRRLWADGSLAPN